MPGRPANGAKGAAARFHADHRLAAGLVIFDLLVDVAELRIPIRMLGAFQGLGVGLQAEPG